MGAAAHHLPSEGDDRQLSQWMGREISELNVVATYNLVFNASLLVDEGPGLCPVL